MSKRRASFSAVLSVVTALGALSCSETSTPTEPTPPMATVTVNLPGLSVCSLSSVRLTVDGALYSVPLNVLSMTLPVSAGHHAYSFDYTNTATPPEVFAGMNGTFDVQAGASLVISITGPAVCSVPH